MGVIEWVLTEIAAFMLRGVMLCVTERAKAQIPTLVDQVIVWAVDRLPEGQRARYLEEWQGHLAETSGDLAKARVAIGLLVASWRMGKTGITWLTRYLPPRKSADIASVTGVICLFQNPPGEINLLVSPATVVSISNITRTRYTLGDRMGLCWAALRDGLKPGDMHYVTLVVSIAVRIVHGVDGTQIEELLDLDKRREAAYAQYTLLHTVARMPGFVRSEGSDGLIQFLKQHQVTSISFGTPEASPTPAVWNSRQ